MAKRYDPILCMLVDEPTKAQDAMPSDLKKAGYEVGTVEKHGSTYYTLVYNGKVISTSPTEANIVEKAKKHYANRHAKAQDVASATQRYINTIVDESKANAEKFVRQAEQDDEVPENELKYVYKAYNEKFGYKFHDSASALDKAIKTCDASYEYEGTYRGAKIQITAPDNDGTRNVYLDGRALWQDEGPVRKVLSAVQQLIDRQKR